MISLRPGDNRHISAVLCCLTGRIALARTADESGTWGMIIRALQLAFIILAIAVIYPFSGSEPVLFPKDTATPDGVVPTQKSDKLMQVQKAGEETIVIASLPTVGQSKTEDDRPFFNDRSVGAGQPEQDLSYLA